MPLDSNSETSIAQPNWTDDPDVQARIRRRMEQLDQTLKPLTDASAASERIGESDWAIRINLHG
jgi:hypothetical protein